MILTDSDEIPEGKQKKVGTWGGGHHIYIYIYSFLIWFPQYSSLGHVGLSGESGGGGGLGFRVWRSLLGKTVLSNLNECLGFPTFGLRLPKPQTLNPSG